MGVWGCAQPRVAVVAGSSYAALAQVTRCTERRGSCKREEAEAWPTVQLELSARRSSPQPDHAYRLLRELIEDKRRQASSVWTRELLVELRKEAPLAQARWNAALLPRETEHSLSELSTLFAELRAYDEGARYHQLAGSLAGSQVAALTQSAHAFEQQGYVAAAAEQLCRAAEWSRDGTSQARQHCAALTVKTSEQKQPFRLGQSVHSDIEQAFLAGLALYTQSNAPLSVEVKLSGTATDVYSAPLPCRPLLTEWDQPGPCAANPSLPMCRPPAPAPSQCKIRTTTSVLTGTLSVIGPDGQRSTLVFDGTPQTPLPAEVPLSIGESKTDIRLVATQRGELLRRTLSALGIARSLQKEPNQSPAHEDLCAKLRLLLLYPHELSAFAEIGDANTRCGAIPRLFASLGKST